MKHLLNIHQDCQHPKPSLYLLIEISHERAIFKKIYLQIPTVKPY